MSNPDLVSIRIWCPWIWKKGFNVYEFDLFLKNRKLSVIIKNFRLHPSKNKKFFDSVFFLLMKIKFICSQKLKIWLSDNQIQLSVEKTPHCGHLGNFDFLPRARKKFRFLAPAPAGNFNFWTPCPREILMAPAGVRALAGGDFTKQISENFSDLIDAQFDYLKSIHIWYFEISLTISGQTRTTKWEFSGNSCVQVRISRLCNHRKFHMGLSIGVILGPKRPKESADSAKQSNSGALKMAHFGK